MDQFGVTSPRLKAKARSPVLPAQWRPLKGRQSNPAGVWLCDSSAIAGMEFSIYGVAQADGGVVALRSGQFGRGPGRTKKDDSSRGLMRPRCPM